MTDEPWVFDKKTLKRIRKEIVPYLRSSRERDMLGLNFSNVEAMAELIDQMAAEIDKLKKARTA